MHEMKEWRPGEPWMNDEVITIGGRPMYYTLDRHTARACSWNEYVAFHRREDYLRLRRVALTPIDGDCEVSTVFLSTDAAFIGPPLVFETMIFGGAHDLEQDRYGTWEEAEAGHAAMVARAMGEA